MFENIEMYMIGWSFGLTLWKRRRRQRPGQLAQRALIAARTSWAALSLRSSENCMVILTWDRWNCWSHLVDADAENRVLYTAATPEAMVMGSAPGKLALTLIVGKTTSRQVGDRQREAAEYAEDHQGRHDQGGHDRPFDEDAGRYS